MAHPEPKNPEPASSSQNVFRVCITGGPCAGKTTVLQKIAETVEKQGIRAYIVPEAATLLNKCGAMINIEKLTQSQILCFQQQLMKMQIELEDSFSTYAAATGEKSVILCDRGIMDGKVYAGDLWQAILDTTGYSLV